jgi:diaminobutyrate-2-oxoglutarate transaminase
VIVDVRGEGLMWGLEFASPESGDSDVGADLVATIQEDAYSKGILVWIAGREGSVLRLMPPLVITERQLEVGLDILEASIRDHAG